jgi:hypothetical protein
VHFFQQKAVYRPANGRLPDDDVGFRDQVVVGAAPACGLAQAVATFRFAQAMRHRSRTRFALANVCDDD